MPENEMMLDPLALYPQREVARLFGLDPAAFGTGGTAPDRFPSPSHYSREGEPLWSGEVLLGVLLNGFRGRGVPVGVTCLPGVPVGPWLLPGVNLRRVLRP